MISENLTGLYLILGLIFVVYYREIRKNHVRNWGSPCYFLEVKWSKDQRVVGVKRSKLFQKLNIRDCFCLYP